MSNFNCQCDAITHDLAGVPSTNCKDLYDSGMSTSGLYLINPAGSNDRSFTVFCDMSLNGGGWTVIQRRVNGDISFNRNWTAYRNGFGKLSSGSFWLGLQNIHEITNSNDNAVYELYIGMESFIPTQVASAYSSFSLGDEDSKYALTISGFYAPDQNCNGGDSLTSGQTNHNGQKFSAPDQDNDQDSAGHCAKTYCSGWWYHDCHDSHLNGKWYADGQLNDVNVPDGIIWEAFRGDEESLKTVVMAIRPV